jgi:hypothetical protein
MRQCQCQYEYEYQWVPIVNISGGRVWGRTARTLGPQRRNTARDAVAKTVVVVVVHPLVSGEFSLRLAVAAVAAAVVVVDAR